MTTAAQEQEFERFINSDELKSTVFAATVAAQRNQPYSIDLQGMSLQVPSMWYSAGSDLHTIFIMERDEIVAKMRDQL